MAENAKARWPVWIAAVLAAGLCATLGLLIAQQFRRARDHRDQARAERAGRPAAPPRRKRDETPRPHVLAERERPSLEDKDLRGESEPSEEDLIRSTILRYFDLMDLDGHPDDMDRKRNYHANRRELEAYLRGLGPEAVPIIADLLRREPDHVNRKILIYGLGEMGWREATEALRDYFLEYVDDKAMGSELEHVIRAIGVSGNELAYETLTQWARDEDPAIDFYDRWIVESLGEHPRRLDAVPLFLQEMTSSSKRDVRNKAAQAIKKVADGGEREALRGAPLSTLLEEVRRESHPYYVRQTMMGAIGSIGDPAGIPVLGELALEHKDPRIRVSAVAALRRIGTVDALDVIRQAAVEDPDERIRSFAAKAMAGMGVEPPEPAPAKAAEKASAEPAGPTAAKVRG